MSAPPFQVMPPLSAEELEALRADIADRGVLVPVLVDQHGRVLDGHHRREIAAELGIGCPTETRMVGSDEEAREIALSLNLTRRHLNREQRRELIRAEIEHRPEDSDRAIARRFGCSPSTVGTVRRGDQVSNLDRSDAVISRIGTELSKLIAPSALVGTAAAVLVEKSAPLVGEDREIDRHLQNSTLALMEHRWKAVQEVGSAREYAQALGVHPSVIAAYVEGWKLWQEAKDKDSPVERDATEFGCSLVHAGEVRFAIGDALLEVEDVFTLEHVADRLRTDPAQLRAWREAAAGCPPAERTDKTYEGLWAAQYGDGS